ncbi:MAG: hypothetical protein JSU65_08580 [Candidatus Zixiibacteriota bacterium]|nr:MAG: hypothetical protein JSU65_08580 [candidate division Zixibacteria bacterium]
MKDQRNEVAGLIEPLLAGENCELAEVVVSRYKSNTTLRVFVYARGGVTLDRCAELSTMLGDVIDGTDMFPDGYTLEVSSPGLTRELTTERDFRYRVGEIVALRFADRGRKKLTAEIVSAVGSEVVFRNDTGEFKVPLDEIEAAKIVF